MKVVADNIKEAPALLRELVEFKTVAMKLYYATRPFSSEAPGTKLAKFATETTLEMKRSLVKNFESTFPTISSALINGSVTIAAERLQGACRIFDLGQRELTKKNCVLVSDADREIPHIDFGDVVTNLVVFILSQFLSSQDEDTVFLSVMEMCEREGVTPDVYKGSLMDDLEFVGGKWCTYDPVSPLYDVMMESEPEFLAECRDIGYPLTDEVCQQILDGVTPVAMVRGDLNQYMKGIEEVEMEGTMSSFLKGMSLE